MDPETGQKLSPNELKSDASQLLAAGSDTISNVVASVMFYLSLNERARERAMAEIRGCFKAADNIQQGPELSSCIYVEACMLEAMRMSPPAGPSPLERVVIRNGIEIDGHWFPQGVTVGTCFYALNMNEDVHESPFEFRPERWLVDEDGIIGCSAENVQRAKSNFFPFSHGHRMCVGRNLATRNVRTVLATLLWHFDFRVARVLEAGEVSGEEGQTGQFEIQARFGMNDVPGHI